MCDRRRLAASCCALAFCCLACLPLIAEGPVARPLERAGGRGKAPPTATEAVQPAAATTQPADDAAEDEHPLKPALRLAQKGLDALAEVTDYQASMARRELVDNELHVETMQMKFREEPFSVYLIFGGEDAGREVLYVDGSYDNKLLAHEGSGLTSFIGTVALPPDSPLVTEHSRHTITDIGMKNMLSEVMTRWEEECKYGECEVKYYHNAKLNDRECLAIECIHPRPRRQFQFHITRVYLDKETNFAVRVENHGFPQQPGGKPVLVEEYTYSNLKTNVGLKDIDFDRKNPQYKF